MQILTAVDNNQTDDLDATIVQLEEQSKFVKIKSIQ